MIEIVLLQPAHLKRITELEKQCFSDPWKISAFAEELKNPLAVYLTALETENQQIIGYAGMWLMVDMANITNVAVHPDFRRQGLAGRMLRQLIKIARMRGMEGITLEVRASNFPAQNLYNALGFSVLGRRKGYYQDREDAIIMTKMFKRGGETHADIGN